MSQPEPQDDLLYPGEVLDTIAGFPTIYHYQSPRTINANKPLIVCVTGGLHLARVFYGGHQGSNAADFLAYWLSQHDFGVLSLSYPLETDPVIMPPTAADFRIPDWGRQAATTARKVIDQYALHNESVILISWSMGGRMVVPFNIAAQELGLNVQQYISFAATPGFSSIRPLPPGITCSASGYFQVPPHVDVFYQQLAEMEAMNGREIIPKHIYLREYIGGTPINLIGLGLKYDGTGGFTADEVPHEEDTRVLDVANWPLISALYPTSILDASHALADRASWGFLLTYKLESLIGKEGLRAVKGTPQWEQLLDLVHSAPARLCRSVPGNHFFFVGEKSAREIAEAVNRLIEDTFRFNDEVSTLIAP
ncbi:hypothetical protein BJX70DRAFT_395757 [Aspergillus crustosus]